MAATNQKKSPAYKLLEHVWRTEGYQMGKSWDRVNHAMGSAMNLAIEYGLRFFRDDFKRIHGAFRGCYWFGENAGERFYTLACDGTHGANMSACLAYEAWANRKPFLVLKDPNQNVKIRVHVGASFIWPDWKNKRTPLVHVTSFANDESYFTAVEREQVLRSGRYHSEKVTRRYKIDHAKIAEYHARIREFQKGQEA